MRISKSLLRVLFTDEPVNTFGGTSSVSIPTSDEFFRDLRVRDLKDINLLIAL